MTGTTLAQTKRDCNCKIGKAAVHYKIVKAKNWFVATSVADKIFPGTKRWLLDCSGNEGGHTIWKWNYGGSGAGGWLQFMQSTYDSYVWAAYREALNRGFKVASNKYLSYYSPLGQAITGAYMRTTGAYRIHWRGNYYCNIS